MSTKKTSKGTELATVNEAPSAISFLQERLKDLKKTVETPYKTNGKINGTSGTIDITTEKDVNKLVTALSSVIFRAKAIDEAYGVLGITEHPLTKIDGSTPEDWTHDVKLKIQIANEDSERKELEQLIEESKQFLTIEDQKKMFIAKLNKKFGSTEA